MSQVIRRVYVDSSAAGGVFNQYAAQTKPFWNAVGRDELIVVLSDVLLREADKAPRCVRELLTQIPASQIERVETTEAAKESAMRYIAEKVVGPTSFDDCLHIALATIVKADVLVSWNFKHIVNKTRIDGYNGVNLLLGYFPIDIRTPYEVIHDEHDF